MTDDTNDFTANSKNKLTVEICQFKPSSQDTEFCQLSPFIRSWLEEGGKCDLFSHRAHRVWDCEKIEILKSPFCLRSSYSWMFSWAVRLTLTSFVHSFLASLWVLVLPSFAKTKRCLLIGQVWDQIAQSRVWQDVTILSNMEGFF